MRVERQPVTDEITLGEETVVMVNHQVVLLSPMASAVLRYLDSPCDVEVLAEALLAVFGNPDERDPVAATQELLENLEAAGLVYLKA